MEYSPLKYLDNDVSRMLCEQVRLSREEEARRFHDDLFHYGEKLNGLNHNIIVNVYDDMMKKNNTPQMASVIPGAPLHPDSIAPYILRTRLDSHERKLNGLPSRYHVPVTIYRF
tara:strand:- start:941 stop:1282 length:342 start_codon:yes stop_codon:yes gene_type:complete